MSAVSGRWSFGGYLMFEMSCCCSSVVRMSGRTDASQSTFLSAANCFSTANSFSFTSGSFLKISSTWKKKHGDIAALSSTKTRAVKWTHLFNESVKKTENAFKIWTLLAVYIVDWWCRRTTNFLIEPIACSVKPLQFQM